MPNEPYAVVVIGASAGGVTALPQVIGHLPADLPAAIFIVQHLFAEYTSILPEILNRAGSLPARNPQDGETVTPGIIYIAPPNHHLLLQRPGRIELSRGARENLHRPAIDPLFRTAARVYGHNTIGVLLTGTMDDGAAGLAAIKLHGGTAIVQDPGDAAYGEMPQYAIDQVDGIDYVAPLAEIPKLVIQTVQQLVQEGKSVTGKEETMAELEEPRILICPECGGALQPQEHGRLLQYRCHVGHIFGLESLRVAYGQNIEDTLWAALRAFREQILLLQRMAERTSSDRLREEYHKQVEAAEGHVQTVQTMLQHLGTVTMAGKA